MAVAWRGGGVAWRWRWRGVAVAWRWRGGGVAWRGGGGGGGGGGGVAVATALKALKAVYGKRQRKRQTAEFSLISTSPNGRNIVKRQK